MLDEAVPILNSVKNGAVIDKKEFDILKPLCNNSLVGASKLLHFINPNLYAIWDSKIYTFLYQEKAHKHRVENIDKYMAYLELIHQMATSTQFEKIITDIQTHFKPNPISNIRAIEWMMFTMKEGIAIIKTQLSVFSKNNFLYIINKRHVVICLLYSILEYISSLYYTFHSYSKFVLMK